MKHTPQPAAWLVMIVLSTVLSCNESDKVMLPAGKTELLTAAPWRRTAFISTPAYDWNANGVAATDVLSIMFPCELDNIDAYRTDGVFVTNEGPTKCNPADPQRWTLTWTFSDDETELIFEGDDVYTLTELSDTTLQFVITFVENGVTYTHVETYGH